MPNDESSVGLFETRAEYLTRDQLESWTALSSRENRVVGKLKGTGAKLLSGPRGCGKSTMMRLAFYQTIESNDVLPVYVNYAKHLAIEPIFKTRPDAVDLFRQWVLAKVIIGLNETEKELNATVPPYARALVSASYSLVESLEVGIVPAEIPKISPTQLISFINEHLSVVERKRAVLLFDDAAHTFSPQQQREFFEIFRQLKTRTVAPKAAVYPGVTNYSANMHIGHDAEIVEAWYRVDDPLYLDTMREVASRRLPGEMFDKFEGDRSGLLDYLALASFGLPRSFLNLLQEVFEYDEDEGNYTTPQRRKADLAIERNCASVRTVFESTGEKIPRYLNLIVEGRRLEDSFLSHLARINTGKSTNQKTTTVGVRRPLAKEFKQVTDLMAYAGIIRQLDSQSRGHDVYERYEMHSGFAIERNALSLGRNPSVGQITAALVRRPPSLLVRGKAETYLGDSYRSRCTLNLTPCTNCDTPRVSEDAQFCMRCGKPLVDKSIYKEMLQRSISDLPIPAAKKKALGNTDLKSIQDILLDVDFKQLREGHYIGSVWAKRIYSAAEEYVSV